MDDWIIPLIIIIASAVYQFFSGDKTRKKEQELEDEIFQPTDNKPSDNDWDELEKALGRKTPSTHPPLEQAPPPEPIPSPPIYTQAPPQHIEPQHSPPSHQKKDYTSPPPTPQKPVPIMKKSGKQNKTAQALKSSLRDKKSIRQAILINEILQSPVTLR